MPIKSLSRIVPFYFGSAERQLFGCYHEPATQGRKCAVLICQPLGHEYVNCHRALRQLASRLCDAGFPVLRFDYYGCGDSSGSGDELTLSQCLADISTALSQLRSRSRRDEVCMIGLRLGGTLSALAAAQQEGIDSLVLWDPVVDGKTYLKELLLLQKEMLRFRPKLRSRHQSRDQIEILGFPLCHFLGAELQDINLLSLKDRPAKNVLVVRSEHPVNEGELHRQWDHGDAPVDYQSTNASLIWLPTDDGSLLVPAQTLQSVVSWTCKTHI